MFSSILLLVNSVASSADLETVMMSKLLPALAIFVTLLIFKVASQAQQGFKVSADDSRPSGQ